VDDIQPIDNQTTIIVSEDMAESDEISRLREISPPDQLKIVSKSPEDSKLISIIINEIFSAVESLDN
jgi:hypothetical protein